MSDLSVREREVVALVANGMTRAKVAAKLGISYRTVEAHLRSAVEKVGDGLGPIDVQLTRWFFRWDGEIPN